MLQARHLEVVVPSMAADSRDWEQSGDHAEVAPVAVAIDAIKVGISIRSGAVDGAHVERLMEVPDRWPPVLVLASTFELLDGYHRVAAARRLGLREVRGVLFRGDQAEAFARAVHANVEHGLPLSLGDRRRAAAHLLSAGPGKSDRAIAAICGLSHGTVGRLRAQLATGAPLSASVGTIRVGADDRSRPVDPVAVRRRIAEHVRKSPNDSLRDVARRVGASPETVRDVRARLARGEDPVPAGLLRPADRAGRPTNGPMTQATVAPQSRMTETGSPGPTTWSEDTACRSEPDALSFAAWFDRSSTVAEWPDHVNSVPLSRAYEVARQARAWADQWRNFADALERRASSAAGRH